MTKKFQLGRGLSSLIPGDIKRGRDIFSNQEIVFVAPDRIQFNPLQPRKIFEHRDLEELINSIKEHGIIQPLIVTKISEDEYQLIAGERRLRSAKFLDLKTVPVIVREAKEVEKLELSLIENIQRKDLNPIERATAYQRLIDEFNFTQEKLAQRIGKNRATLANTLRLLNLPEEIQKALAEERITEGHGKLILSAQNPVQQVNIFRKVLLGKLTVSQTDAVLKNKKNKRPKIKNHKFEILEERLRNVFGTRVEIKKSGKTGKIIIEFYSPEDLDEIVRKIRG